MDSITPGPKLVINCPACKIAGAIAVTATVEHTTKLLWLIPLFTSKKTEVHCTRCATQFGSRHGCQELAGMTREQASSALISRSAGDGAARLSVVAGLVLCVIPYIGLIMSLSALIKYRKRRGRWKIAAIIGFVISVLTTLVAIIGTVMGTK